MSVDNNYSDLVVKRDVQTKKRLMSKKLQEVREKTALNKYPEQGFAYDMMLMFCKAQLSVLLITPLLVVTIAAVSSYLSPTNSYIVLWACTVITFKGVLYSICRNFISSGSKKLNIDSWLIKISIIEFLCGLSIAAVVFVDFSYVEDLARLLLFAVILIFLAMRMLFASMLPIVFFVGTLPIVLALFVKAVYFQDFNDYITGGLVLSIYLCFSIFISKLNNNFLEMLSSRSEKDFLIAEIEEAKAFSDEARRRAEEANIAKSRFLATMSHELRTPLNAILGFSEVMKDELFGQHHDQRYKDYSNDIHTSGEHLLNLINEILDLSRIEAGRYELQEEAITLSDVSTDCCRLLQLKADKKELKIIQDYNDLEKKLWADERAVRQIIINLLSNAIKFTPNGGVITVKTDMNTEKELLISIKDTGPGIPEKEIPIILTNFGQGSLAHETAEGGSGLGLPIVKGLIEIHGGRFELSSVLRKGTEVQIFFPANRVSHILNQVPLSNIQSKSKNILSIH